MRKCFLIGFPLLKCGFPFQQTLRTFLHGVLNFESELVANGGHHLLVRLALLEHHEVVLVELVRIIAHVALHFLLSLLGQLVLTVTLRLGLLQIGVIDLGLKQPILHRFVPVPTVE